MLTQLTNFLALIRPRSFMGFLCVFLIAFLACPPLHAQSQAWRQFESTGAQLPNKDHAFESLKNNTSNKTNMDVSVDTGASESSFFFTHSSTDSSLLLSLQAPKDYYIYASSLKLTHSCSTIANSAPSNPLALITDLSDSIETLTPSTIKDDPNFGQVKVFLNASQFAISLPKEKIQSQCPLATSPSASIITLIYQGCSASGVCFAPSFISYSWPQSQFISSGYSADLPQNKDSQIPSNSWLDFLNLNAALKNALSSSFLLAVLVGFLCGLAISLSPCTLPLIAVGAKMLSSFSQTNKKSKYAYVKNTSSYILGFSICFATLSTLLLHFSKNLSVLLLNPYINSLVVIIMLLMALANYGLFGFTLPSALQSFFHNIKIKLLSYNAIGWFFSGAASVAIIGPCAAPALAAIILALATTSLSLVWVWFILFALAIGQSFFLFIYSLGLEYWVPKSSPLTSLLQRWLSIAIVFFALYLAQPLTGAMWAMALAATFSFVLCAQALKDSYNLLSPTLRKISKTSLASLWASFFAFTLFVFLGSGYTLSVVKNAPSNFTTPWLAFSSSPISSFTDNPNIKTYKKITSFTELKKTLSPVSSHLLYFSADWCASCKPVKDSIIKSLLPQPVSLIEFDLTQNTPQSRKLLSDLTLAGAPSIIFLSAEKLALVQTDNDLIELISKSPTLSGLASKKEIADLMSGI